jgi:predicted restriction endonuclease
VRKLKDLYDNRCQVCGYTFEYDKGKFYSEVHHYNPLEEDGPDDISNMIVVCSNHHAEFDYKMMAIDIDERSLINKKGNKVGEITFHKNHRLDKKNILSQMING